MVKPCKPLSKRAYLSKQYPQDAVLQTHTTTQHHAPHSGATLVVRFASHTGHGIGIWYLPVIQYPEDTAYTGWLSTRAIAPLYAALFRINQYFKLVTCN